MGKWSDDIHCCCCCCICARDVHVFFVPRVAQRHQMKFKQHCFFSSSLSLCHSFVVLKSEKYCMMLFGMAWRGLAMCICNQLRVMCEQIRLTMTASRFLSVCISSSCQPMYCILVCMSYSCFYVYIRLR